MQECILNGRSVQHIPTHLIMRIYLQWEISTTHTHTPSWEFILNGRISTTHTHTPHHENSLSMGDQYNTYPHTSSQESTLNGRSVQHIPTPHTSSPQWEISTTHTRTPHHENPPSMGDQYNAYPHTSFILNGRISTTHTHTPHHKNTPFIEFPKPHTHIPFRRDHHQCNTYPHTIARQETTIRYYVYTISHTPPPPHSTIFYANFCFDPSSFTFNLSWRRGVRRYCDIISRGYRIADSHQTLNTAV